MPFNANQVGQLQGLVAAILQGHPAGAPVQPDISEKELAMKTTTRDMLLVNLDQLIHRAGRMKAWLNETPPRSITDSVLEAQVTPLVAEVDVIFVACAPNMEKQAAAVRGGGHDEDDDADTSDQEDDRH